ncbi:HRDC domain-containing protein [Niabella ginsengisoli]|uniref:HRDC domain-containing protein n=1 Tax=Niabella ginsengisoli TaxID=522298 RepID=UPI00374C93D1
MRKRSFLTLKAVRRTCAEENDLPAFIICGDQVLRDICFKKPTDKQSLLAVKGIGEKFTDKYGSAFIQSIQTHLQQ